MTESPEAPLVTYEDPAPTMIQPGALSMGPGTVTAEPITITATCLPMSVENLCAQTQTIGRAPVTHTSAVCDAARLDFEFKQPQPQKVLLHKYRTEDDYPSVYQQRVGLIPGIPSPDRHIQVEVLVSEQGQPLSGRNVYFRVTDPPDEALYTVAAGVAQAGDNRDPNLPEGELLVFEPCSNPAPGSPVCAVSQADGFARVILKTSEHISGENYHVEASLDASFSCAPACERSGMITTWKRVYVEVNNMYRQGASIIEPFGPTSGNVELIQVSDVRPFQNQPPGFVVRLLHGRSILHGPRHGIGFEEVRIRAVFRDNLFPLAAPTGRLELDLAPGNTVTRDYYPAETVGGVIRPATADAVVLPPTGRTSSFFTAFGDRVNAFFAGAFVDYVWLIDPAATAPEIAVSLPAAPVTRIDYSGWIPNSGRINSYESGLAAIKWTRNVAVRYDLIGPPARASSVKEIVLEIIAAPNHQPLFVADRSLVTGAIRSGLTYHEPGARNTWIYTRSITDQSGDPDYPRWAIAHELGHQWDVNNTPPVHDLLDSGGHCGGIDPSHPPLAPGWTASTPHCLMTHDARTVARASTESSDIAFHYRLATQSFTGATITPREDSEYLYIRELAEPIPQR